MCKMIQGVREVCVQRTYQIVFLKWQEEEILYHQTSHATMR